MIINLDRVLTWQKSTTTPDDVGQRIETWSDYKQVWGMLYPLRGTELYESDQKVALGNRRYVVRYDDGWSEMDRVKDEDGTVMEITSIAEYVPTKKQGQEIAFRKHYLTLICEERDSSNTGRD